MRRDASQENIDREVRGMGLGSVNAALVKSTWEHMLLQSAYRVEQMRAMVAQTLFETCTVDASGVGFVVRMHKR